MQERTRNLRYWNKTICEHVRDHYTDIYNSLQSSTMYLNDVATIVVSSNEYYHDYLNTGAPGDVAFEDTWNYISTSLRNLINPSAFYTSQKSHS